MSEDLYCPICSELMFEPVVLKCGHSFDRTCVENWFDEKLRRSCPYCREEVGELFPNLILKNLIREHAEKNNIPIPEPPPRNVQSIQPTTQSAPPEESSSSSPEYLFSSNLTYGEILLNASCLRTDTLNELLSQAARYGNLDRLRLWIAAGADVHYTCAYNALHHAAGNGHFDCVGELIRAGANVNAQDIVGETALYKAAEKGRLECVRSLLSSGAIVDRRSNSGWTALHRVAMTNHLDCARLLIRAGADVNARCRWAYKPIDYAESREMKKLLSDASPGGNCSIM